MNDSFYRHLDNTLQQIRDDGFFKRERLIATPQQATLRLESGAEVINFCANNYLGLADDARLIRRETRARRLRFRHGVGAFHMWHANQSPRS